jgi:hypothetical protein
MTAFDPKRTFAGSSTDERRGLDQPLFGPHLLERHIVGASGILAYFAIEAAKLLTNAI